ncbi:MAG: glycyl-radical enzyme activating protein [Bacteroidales bacterium]|nr:glycyl-radical enzyme activating protein [Bacteroidales bacterium]
MNILKYFDISWFSSVDGPGTRVVLYLLGCNLRCPWCHSPHSWETSSPLLYFESRCTKCGCCVDICPNGVHEVSNGIHLVNHSQCNQCGACIEICPSSDINKWNTSALGFAGKDIEVSELYQLLKPQLDLLKGIGGLTVSGGDPLVQSKALVELLKICSADGIHTTVETSATLNKKHIEELMPYVNHWLIGLRPSRTDKVEDWKQLLSNIELLAAHNPDQITIRTPIIPGYTNTQIAYDMIIEVMRSNRIKSIEILPYNPYSENYYKAMGIEYPLKGTQVPSKEELIGVKDNFTSAGIKAKIVA